MPGIQERKLLFCDYSDGSKRRTAILLKFGLLLIFSVLLFSVLHSSNINPVLPLCIFGVFMALLPIKWFVNPSGPFIELYDDGIYFPQRRTNILWENIRGVEIRYSSDGGFSAGYDGPTQLIYVFHSGGETSIPAIFSFWQQRKFFSICAAHGVKINTYPRSKFLQALFGKRPKRVRSD